MAIGESRVLGIFAEDLGTYTTGTPSREMLRELIKMRPQDRFLFIFCKGGDKKIWVEPYVSSLSQAVRIESLGRTRKVCNMRVLLGLSAFGGLTMPHADVYLRFNTGGLGVDGKPLIDLVTDFSSLDQYRSSLAWHGRILARRGYKSTFSQSAYTVAISKATAESAREYCPEMQTTLQVIHNGIANDWHVLGASDSPEIENFWIWYGHVTERKNLVNLLYAYKRLHRDRNMGDLPRLRIIARRSRGRDELSAIVAATGLDGSVVIQDPLGLNELISAVRSSRGVVLPSFYEGFGMPIAEAMACGRPVLTSDSTSMPEIAGGNAVLCNPYDIDSIADGLRSLLDPQQDTPKRRSARRAHAAQFTAKNAAVAYSKLIDDLLVSTGAAVK